MLNLFFDCDRAVGSDLRFVILILFFSDWFVYFVYTVLFVIVVIKLLLSVS